jgi:uncharacterized membrane protein YqjE
VTNAHQTGEDAADQATLSEDVRRLIDHGKGLAEAELAWQKARASYAAGQAGVVALLGLLALALAFFALMALVVGALAALVPALGLWGATAAVAGTLVVAALIAAAIAMLKLRSTARLIADRKHAP